MGYLDHVSELCSVTSTRKSKRKNMETVEIKVKMDCDGCERRVKNAASSLKGHLSLSVSPNIHYDKFIH
ncbi:putative heavy metal-associated domain, HMA, heavy metal-associated domain superfamily [Helianthus debilis subsp. tardiflorus]